MFAAALGDGLVAFKLGLAVYAERAGGAGFLPGFGAVAGVYVVAAVVHQEGALLCRVFGQLFGQAGVQAAGFGLLFFCGVYGCPGGGVYDEVWVVCFKEIGRASCRERVERSAVGGW